MPNRLAIAALALVLGIVAVAAVVASNAAPVLAGSCAPLEGGGNGGTSQVRFLDARDDHVTFTFGQSAIGSFEVPRYRLEQSGSASDRRTFALRFGAASTTNPDGSPSLEALPLLQPEDRVLRQVRFREDRDGVSLWELESGGATCPRIAVKRYAQGSFPRAQIIVSFGNTSSITLEPNPPLGPQLWVSGAGFSASSTVSIALGGAVVTTAPTTADGSFEKGLYVFDLDPGVYRVGVSDARGHAASNQLTVPRQPLVPDLVPRR